MHSVKLWDHLLQILPVLPPQIILLYAASPTPRPSFPHRPIYYGVLPENLVLNRCNYAPSPNHATRRYPQRMVNLGPHANRIPVANAWRLDPYNAGQPHHRSSAPAVSRGCQHSRQPISNRLLSPMRITSLRLHQCAVIRRAACPFVYGSDRYRFIMTVPSSIMQLFPITTGPVCPKMTTFGCTTVPAPAKHRSQSLTGLSTPHRLSHLARS